MIEISEKVSQVVYFPKTMKSTGPYTLKIHSELSQKDWYIDNLLDQANLNDYYKFTVDFTEVDDGEFNYSISKADDTFDTGLIRIGVVQNYGQGYNTEVEIVQYDMYSDPQIRHQHKSISATTNGNYYVTPDEGYVALSEVDIYVNVPSDSGASYESGYTKGYESGYTQGSEDGYGSGYTSGKTDGIAEQKAKLVATAFTQNGTYARNDGWNSVVIDVSGYTEQDLLDAFNSGYTNGKAEGYNSGWTNGYNSGNTDGYESGWTDGYISGYTDGSGQTPSTAATALTISVPSSITGTGKVNVTAEPSTAILDLVYTSSDPTIATVDSNGNITVLSAGTITITVTDRNSGLFDTQTITVEPASKLNTPLTFNIISGGTINWTASNTAYTKTIEYSLDNGSTWASITSNTGSAAPSISVSAGDKIQFKGDNATYSDSVQYSTFSGTTARFEVEGNIMSLIDSTGFETAATLTETYTFSNLFRDCSGLTSAENLVLPASVLTDYCYGNMFRGCTSLTTAPSLPATTLANGCYYQMFNSCTTLTIAPSLPATTLTVWCYGEMFGYCTSLTTAPELPANTLAQACYYSMFQNCTSLTTAPELPATTLANGCYREMFSGCTSLTTAPSLPATTLANSCYRAMFYGCTLLNRIKCLGTDISAYNCTVDWVNGVAPTGTFVKDASMTGWTTGNNGIPTGWVVKNDGPDLTEPLTFNIISSGTIYWKAQDTSYTTTIEYSKDNGSTWSNITSTTAGTSFNVNAGDKVMFRGDNATYSTGYNKMNTFNGSTAIFEVEGNIMSLIDSTGFTTATTLASSLTFYDLFSNCIGLTTAENLALPATTLTESCYCLMFSGCTSLTTAPELPATTLLNVCYAQMFQGCTSLTTPPELPARNLAFLCYSKMFWGCTSLTTAPELPATILTDSCYVGMFSGCTNLNYIKCLATDITANSCTEKWVEGVQTNSGTFVKDANTTWPTGNSGIPNNWTVQDAQ